MKRSLLPVSATVLLSLLAPAFAAETSLPAPALPSLAANPQENFWSGLSVGSSIFTSFQKGSKPLVGGAGTVAFDKKLDQNWSIGVGASAGFAPYSIARSPYKGYNFATTDVKLAYDMGRIKPWISTGIVVAKASAFNTVGNVNDSVNSLFNGRGLKTFGTVAAGVDYEVTNNLKVGIAVHMNNAALAPGLLPAMGAGF